MAHWNYRILRYADGGYGLHEVYYDDPDGDTSGISWTLEPICFTSDEAEGSDGVINSLRLALADAERRPILQINETWAALRTELGH